MGRDVSLSHNIPTFVPYIKIEAYKMAPYSLIHIIDSDEVLSIPNPSERTPPSDRIRRAALHKFPGSQLSDLGHSRISKKEGRPYESVVGRGSAMKLLGENSRNASDVSERLSPSMQNLC